MDDGRKSRSRACRGRGPCKADAHCCPLIQNWKAGLARKDKRAESEAALAVVKDPRAVPSIWKAFATGSSDDQEMAVDILGYIDGERPSRAVAGLAILGKTDVIRRAATTTLARRNHMDILMDWIGLLHDPVKYEVKQVAGPGMAGVLFVEGEQYNMRRFYMPPTAAQIGDSTSQLIPEGFMLPLKTDSPPPWPPRPGARQIGIADGVPLFEYDYTWAPKGRRRNTMTRRHRISSTREVCCKRRSTPNSSFKKQARLPQALRLSLQTTSM